jgi:DNA-binding LytR/AlgR family response regulator
MAPASTATALIADDEELPRLRLAEALARAWPQLRVVAEAGNGVDAWDAWLEHEPQVCFLDVRMPGLTGIEVAQRIGARALTVFVTPPGDHALAAFDAGAVDYVLKPVDGMRIDGLVARVQARLAHPVEGAAAALQGLLDRLARQVRRPAPLEVIPSGIGNEANPVQVADVVYFESEGRATRVVHAGGELLLRTPLKELLAQLDPLTFWQVHRSVVVNPLHIDRAVAVGAGNMLLTLRGRSEWLPVSRHFQGLFALP